MAASAIESFTASNRVSSTLTIWFYRLVITAIRVGGSALVIIGAFYLPGLWFDRGFGSTNSMHDARLLGFLVSAGFTYIELHGWQLRVQHGSFFKAFKSEFAVMSGVFAVWFVDIIANIGGLTCLVTGNYYQHRITPPTQNIMFNGLILVVIAFALIYVPTLASLFAKAQADLEKIEESERQRKSTSKRS
jgi:hypothetical protein